MSFPEAKKSAALTAADDTIGGFRGTAKEVER